MFNERLKAEGNWVFAGALAAPDTATVIDNRGEEALVTAGPFLESKEYLEVQLWYKTQCRSNRSTPPDDASMMAWHVEKGAVRSTPS